MGKKRYWRPQTRALLQIMVWTVCLVCGLAFANFLFILHTIGPGLGLDRIPLQMSRAPASTAATEHSDLLEKTPIVTVNCQESSADRKLETKAPTFRIMFFGCPEITGILNATNASQGDLFLLKSGWSGSDFILLNKGHNEVFVEFATKTMKLEVHRQVAKEPLPANPI